MQTDTNRSRAARSSRGAGLIKAVGISAAVLLVAAGGIWAVTGRGGGSGDVRTVSSLDLAEVSRGSFEVQTTAIGELEARNQIEIRSELGESSEIVQIVEEGKVVKKGDLLVQLNAEALQDEIDEDTLEVEQARADVTARENALKIQISDNESRLRAGLLNLELAKLALRQWEEGDVVKMRQQQKLDIEQAQRDFERLKDRYERSKELLSQGFLSKDECKQDEISFINAEARLATARLDQQTYEEFQFPRDQKTKLSDVEEAQAELERIESQNEINAAAKRSELDTARRRLELREENLQEEIDQLAKATILAPTDGLVVYSTSVGRDRDRMMFGGDGPLQIGSQVRPNQNLIILPDTSSMVASVRVHESLAGRIRPGQPARIKVDAQGGETYTGRVTSIGVLAETGGWRDPNRREYTVRIAIDYDNTDGELKPSMRAEAVISLAEVKDSLMVPVQAVFSEGPLKYVHVPSGSRFKRVPVKLGRISDEYAEVLVGVEAGQRVLLRAPATGEVTEATWSEAEVTAVGLKLDEKGTPTIDREAAAQAMQSRMQQRGEFQMRTGGAPDGEQRRGRQGGERGSQQNGESRAAPAESQAAADAAPAPREAEAGQTDATAETPAVTTPPASSSE